MQTIAKRSLRRQRARQRAVDGKAPAPVSQNPENRIAAHVCRAMERSLAMIGSCQAQTPALQRAGPLDDAAALG
jgi:hypothetical protein